MDECLSIVPGLSKDSTRGEVVGFGVEVGIGVLVGSDVGEEVCVGSEIAEMHEDRTNKIAIVKIKNFLNNSHSS